MKKQSLRAVRHKRILKKTLGTPQRPRLNIFRSLRNINAQIIDDISGKVIMNVSTLEKELKEKIKDGGNVKAASILGEVLAQRAKNKGITKVAFDRGGYLYHGRVKALAESARKAGLEF